MKGEPIDILLVEDNPDHAELVIRELGQHAVANRVRWLTDGEQALDYLMRRGEFAAPTSSPRPHLVLLDIGLPRFDGLEVLARLKASPHHKAIPVVIMTTSQAEADKARAYESHANAYVVKPLDFDGFHDMMKDLGFFWLAWNQAPALD